MCRMVGYQGEAVPLASLIFGGPHSLARQSYQPRELLSGSVNADGFGVVWYDAGDHRALREHRPIWHNPDLEAVLESIRAGLVLAAVRNVTPGIAVDPSGTPPVVRGGLAVVLNGYLENFAAAFLRESVARLSNETLALAQGLSDTEFVCLELVEAAREQHLSDAVSGTVRSLLGRATALGRTAQLNLLVSDGRTQIAVRASNASTSNSLYLGRGLGPAPHGVTVASEPLTPDQDWETVPHNCVVDLATGRTQGLHAPASTDANASS